MQVVLDGEYFWLEDDGALDTVIAGRRKNGKIYWERFSQKYTADMRDRRTGHLTRHGFLALAKEARDTWEEWEETEES